MDRDKVKCRLLFWYTIFVVFFVSAFYLSYFVYFMDLGSTKSKWIGLFAGAIALLLGVCKICEFSFFNNDDTTKNISSRLFKFSNLYLKKQSIVAFIFCFIFSCIIYFFLKTPFAVGFLIGAVILWSNLLISNVITSKIGAKIINTKHENRNVIYKLASCASSSLVLLSSGIFISSIVILYHIYKDFQILLAYLLGAFSFSIINSISYSLSQNASKGTDETIAKFSNSFSINDKRNPVSLLLTISKAIFPVNKSVCENFLICSLVLISSISTGAMSLNLMGAFMPIILFAGAVFSSVFVLFVVKIRKNSNLIRNCIFANFLNLVLFSLIAFGIVKFYYPDTMGIYGAIVFSSCVGFIFSCIYANKNFIYNSVRNVVNSSVISSSAPLLQTFKEAFLNTFLPVFVVAIVVIVPFFISYGCESPMVGLYGMTLGALGFCSISLINRNMEIFSETINSYSNLKIVFEELVEPVDHENYRIFKNQTSRVFALVKTYKYLASFVAIGSCLVTYSVLATAEEINLLNPYVLFSILIGCVIPVVFSGFMASGVSGLIIKLIFEIKARFKRLSQTNDINIEPDYMKCCEISSVNSSIFAVIYIAIVLFALISIVIKFGLEGAYGLLFGLFFSSVGIVFLINKCSFIARTALQTYEFEKENANVAQEYGALENNDALFSNLSSLALVSTSALIKFLVVLSTALIPLFALITMVK